MAERVRSHPDNAAGPFYVEYGCCTACGVPEAIAPELFAWDGDSHCFVKRQPLTLAETDKAIQVVAHAELSCIRYRGLDPEILTRFAELGEPELCDFGARFDLKSVLRDRALFVDLREIASSPSQLAGLFHGYLVAQRGERYRVTAITSSSPDSASFEVSWFENNFHRVVFCRAVGTARSWLAQHHGNRGVSSLLHEWLNTDGRFSDIRWYSESSWEANGSWRSTPW